MIKWIQTLLLKRQVKKFFEETKDMTPEEFKQMLIKIDPSVTSVYRINDRLNEIHKEFIVTDFTESEETESGVFGVHIVFERKQEV